MRDDITTAEARTLLRTRAQLLHDDVPPSAVRNAGRAGPLARVHHGVYVARSALEGLRASERHRLAVVAAVHRMRDASSVVSHVSAAVLHGLPLYRFEPGPVEITVAGGVRASSRTGVRRHLDRLDDHDIVEVDGIRCTSVERTVFDVARTRSKEMALGCADAAARGVAVEGRRFDADAQEEWRAGLRERAARSAGRRGIRSARWVVEFADGRAELPGESVSRLQFARLGFREFVPQLPVPGPRGADYLVDLALPERRLLWEFDGEQKYLDEAMRGGRSVERVLLDEKRREDWIRGRTGWTLLRGGFRDIATPSALAARLTSFGVPLPAP